MENLYLQVVAAFEKTDQLDLITGILQWDLETKMPPQAIRQRSDEMALLAQLTHQSLNDPSLKQIIHQIQHPEFSKLDAIKQRNIHLMKRIYDQKACVPEKLAMDLAKQKAISVGAWKKAKKESDFKIFEPELKKTMELKVQQAQWIMKARDTATPYDAMIDIFEPAMSTKHLAKIFNELKKGLIKIIKKSQDKIPQTKTSFLKRAVPLKTQQAIGKRLTEIIGYDIQSENAKGRLDETEHPFTVGRYDDVRITTNYALKDFTNSLFSILHEGGHALYNQNLNSEWKYQAIGRSCSYGIHESQSRFIENIIGKSQEFWQFFYPELIALTGNIFSDISLESFIQGINLVQPSPIRIEADEVTYSLHIIIRFEIEQGLFEDKIMVNELPSVWHDKYEQYLGLDIQDDAIGVLQDTHWASGYFGYFPSYALGNLYGGQMLLPLEKEIPDWKNQIEQGDLDPVIDWLKKNVHAQSKRYDPLILIEKITNQELNAQHYLSYLDQKFKELYNLEFE